MIIETICKEHNIQELEQNGVGQIKENGLFKSLVVEEESQHHNNFVSRKDLEATL